MGSRASGTLQRVLPDRAGRPLHDAAATRAIEARALAALPPHTLMQRAGRSVARLALASFPWARSVHALAGPGNNGGDALVACVDLRQCGWQTRVSLLGDAAKLPGDAARALAQAVDAGVAVDVGLPRAWPGADVLLDGLLGLGASRAPQGALAQAIESVNRLGAPTLAIDLPSGLDGDSGRRLGAAAVRAEVTLSLLTLKPGLFTAQGRDHAGQIWFDPLGVELAPSTLSLLGHGGIEGPAAHASHKGSFGDVIVVGGAPGMAGAAWLAARAALTAGAGRVYLALLGADGIGAQGAWPELMHRAIPRASDAPALADQTVVCGCGGGREVGASLPALLAHAGRLVLDADALNAIAAETSLRKALEARGARARPTVLTPHPLEAARLLGCPAQAVQTDRLACARELARRFGCIAVLKGSGTVVARADGPLALNPTGNALLATPGSGDVLAGWIGGAWSRLHRTAEASAIVGAAVWRHGRAADLAALARPARPNLLAGELIEQMRDAGR